MAFVIDFQIGQPGSPSDGDVAYFSPLIAGEKVKVFREGLYQYNQKGTNYIINFNTGTIFFVPAFYDQERIRIQTV